MNTAPLTLRLSIVGMLLSANFACASSSVALQADQDAVVATGVSDAFVGNNYGGAGATAVAGSGTARLEQRTITRFDTASAKTTFDAAFGVGLWRIESVTLQLSCTVPGGANPVFNNPNVAGSFRINWIPTDTWTEGTGTPNSPTTDGVTWNDMATLGTGAVSQGTQSFSGIAGLTTYTLTPTSELLADIKAGSKASFILDAVDATMSMVIHSRTFTTASNRPVLTITASPSPAVTQAATNLTGDKATLRGLANANGGTLSLFFDYGETTSYGTSVAASPSSATGMIGTDVSLALTGLAPLTQYHFRLRAYDGVNTFLGDDLTFTTLTSNSPPTISDISDLAINASTSTGPISLTIGDVETAAASLNVSAASSNQTLVPDANIVLGGSGENRSLSILPVSSKVGTATITVTVSDGVASASDSFVLTVENRPLQVNLVGNGTIAAPFAGPYPQTLNLVNGKSYTIKATPKTGSVFNGWSVTNAANTGITVASQELPSLTFTMQSGLTLTANFITNPFTAVAGSYTGLVHASATQPAPGASLPSLSTEGLFTANLTGTGSFTGTLLVDGLSLAVNGLFDNGGTARFGTARTTSLSVARPGKPSLIVALHLDLSGVDRITGTVTQMQRNAVSAVSDISADRAAFNGTTSIVPNDYLTVNGTALSDGKFTVILPPKDLAAQPAGFTLHDYPQGHGIGTLAISKAGKVTLSATLADGTAFTVSSLLSKDKACPLFAQLYSKLGFFSAQLVLNKDDPDSHASAVNALWSRPYLNTQWYPFGWPEVIKTDLFAAKYAAVTGTSVLPACWNPVATTVANADITFSGANLLSAITKAVSLSSADVSTNVPKTDTSFSLVVTRSTGAISGSFTNGTTRPTFKGTVYQKGSHAGAHGFFLTTKPTVLDYTGESGDVLLLAKPMVN